jgi:hypothetical protein
MRTHQPGEAAFESHQRARGRRARQGRGLRQRRRGLLLDHSDFEAKLEDLTSLPAGPTGLLPWPDFLARLTRAPIVSIALIRGRATGNGSEITLACDMSFPAARRPSSRNGRSAWEWPQAGGPWLDCPNSSAAIAPSRCC